MLFSVCLAKMTHCVAWDMLSTDMKRRIVLEARATNGTATLPDATPEPPMLATAGAPDLARDACTPVLQRHKYRVMKPTDFDTHHFQDHLAERAMTARLAAPPGGNPRTLPRRASGRMYPMCPADPAAPPGGSLAQTESTPSAG